MNLSSTIFSQEISNNSLFYHLNTSKPQPKVQTVSSNFNQYPLSYVKFQTGVDFDISTYSSYENSLSLSQVNNLRQVYDNYLSKTIENYLEKSQNRGFLVNYQYQKYEVQEDTLFNNFLGFKKTNMLDFSSAFCFSLNPQSSLLEIGANTSWENAIGVFSNANLTLSQSMSDYSSFRVNLKTSQGALFSFSNLTRMNVGQFNDNNQSFNFAKQGQIYMFNYGLGFGLDYSLSNTSISLSHNFDASSFRTLDGKSINSFDLIPNSHNISFVPSTEMDFSLRIPLNKVIFTPAIHAHLNYNSQKLSFIQADAKFEYNYYELSAKYAKTGIGHHFGIDLSYIPPLSYCANLGLFFSLGCAKIYNINTFRTNIGCKFTFLPASSY